MDRTSIEGALKFQISCQSKLWLQAFCNQIIIHSNNIYNLATKKKFRACSLSYVLVFISSTNTGEEKLKERPTREAKGDSHGHLPHGVT